MNVIDDCKKYFGLYPYNTWANIVVSDSYFYMDMCKKYGKEIVNKTLKTLRNKG